MFGSQRRIVHASPSCNARALIDPLEPRRLMSIMVTGNLYNDLNANGRQDAGEPGLSGWVVYHDANKNRVRDPGEAFASSDVTGKYVLTGFGFTSANLTEYIREDKPPGWQLTQPGATAAPGTTNDGAYWIRPYFTLQRTMPFYNRNFGNHYVGAAVASAASTAPAAMALTAGPSATGFDQQFFGAEPITA